MTTAHDPPEPHAGPAGAPWWKGRRGEWLVVIQIALMSLVAIGPRTIGNWPAWPSPWPGAAFMLGLSLFLSGGALFLAGLLRLGPSLTALPYPKADGVFIARGPYAVVRHPIYAGGILVSVGWALALHGWLTLAYAAVLCVFLDVKSRQEERWLVERFPEYRAYQRRVRKLVPFIY